MVLEKIDYKKVFYFFEEISSVPRGSKNNEGISDYLVSFARARDLNYVQDEYLNIIIYKDATEGYEEVPTLILQGHMDMVCEKQPDIEHDFTKEGLELKVDGDYVYANGTTLGGDDGIALAYALAILDDNEMVHPNLEVLITTDEEIGMDGAINLDGSLLKGSYLINLDSEEEGTILTSCAGGLTACIKMPLEYETVEEKQIRVMITGLTGGHSGMDIDKNRTNANLLLGRLLFELRKQNYHITQLYGGQKDNVITRDAVAYLTVAEEDIYSFINDIKFLTEIYKGELRNSEPNLSITIEQSECKEYQVLTKQSMDNIIFMLLNIPHGVQVMSSNIPNLVESSLNLGIFYMEDNQVYFSFSVRSSLGSYKQFMSEKLRLLADFIGGSYEIKGEYPAWEYQKDSKLRNLAISIYEKQYGNEPKIEAIHAGLECGIISNKLKNVDIISIGPDILDIHSPQERLSISSTIRVFDYVVNLMEAYVTTIK